MSSRETARTPRQVFGAMLRYYRERAGLSRTELARQISKSVSLIQAIELGQRAATADVTEDLERVLPADGALTRLRDEIGDGLGYQAYPSWFQDWLVSEREAKKLRWFEPMFVPGLLQTEDYARAIFRTRFGMTSEEIDELVAARLKRQEILAREQPPAFWVIVDEAVLRRPVGGRYVMREQVNRADRRSLAPARVDTGNLLRRGRPPWLCQQAHSSSPISRTHQPSATRTLPARASLSTAAKMSKPSPTAGIRSYARRCRGPPLRRSWKKWRSHGHRQCDLAQGQLQR